MKNASQKPSNSSMTAAHNLNLRHLRGLLAVHEYGSISVAAQEVNLSQPALTQGILKIERQLGEVLFERRPAGVIPTSSGKVVIDRTKAAMRHLNIGCRLVAGKEFEPDRRLTMTQLHALLSLVKTGSFAGASELIGLSQAAIHRSVRELEEAFDRKLVERRGRGIHINFAGRRFARTCRLAFNELETALSELGLDPHNQIISIGTTPLARAFLVPEAMAHMVSQGYPAGFRVLEGSWGELVESLRDGQIDMIVGELTPEGIPDLVMEPLYKKAPVIVAGRNHPLVGRNDVRPENLASYPWIIAPDTSPLRAEWERLFALEKPSVPVECGSIMIIGRLLTSSEMLTLAMPDQVALQIRTGLLASIGEPLSANAPTIGTTMRQSWQPTLAQRDFLDLLRSVAQEMNSEGDRKSFIESKWV
jgi:LysR family transcriptional regulator of gallate degradation